MTQKKTTYELHDIDEIFAWKIRKLALFAGKVFMLVHVLFILFQIFGIVTVPMDDIANIHIYWYATISNIIVVSITFVFWAINTKAQNDGKEVGAVFNYSILVVSFTILLTWLFHLHIGGSLNSLILSMILAGLMVITSFLKQKAGIIFFIIGNIGVFSIIALEYFEVIPYAPLFTQSAELKVIFLDWRSMLTSGMIYLGMITIVGIITFKVRSSLEDNSRKLYNTNIKLIQEIEERKRIQNENERLISELKQALDEVKTLEDLMPICSSCKKIRDDSGYWQQVEGYLAERAGATFTHGLCPDCARKLYPEFAKEDL